MIVKTQLTSATDYQVEYKGKLLEPSEDVRLLLIQLLQLLLKQAKNLIGPFASDIASILMSAAADKDPVVLKVFADCIKATTSFPNISFFRRTFLDYSICLELLSITYYASIAAMHTQLVYLAIAFQIIKSIKK